MVEIHVDFETYSKETLNLGVDHYARHRSTDIWCMCYLVDGGSHVEVWAPGDEIPEVFKKPFAVVAHNYAFEQAIWEYVLAPRYGFLLPIDYKCTMALAHYNNLPPSLENLAERLSLVEQKDTVGGKLMKRMAKANSYKPDEEPDHEENFKTLVRYCAQDVRTEAAAYHRDYLSSVHEAEFQLDRRINGRGIYVDVKSAKAIFAGIELERKTIAQQLEQKTGGIKARSSVALTQWLKERGYGGDNVQEETVRMALDSPGGLSDSAKEVLQMRQQLSLGSLKKLDVMAKAAGPDGRLRGLFQLAGAGQTARWAGRMVQFQNLPRSSMSDLEIESHLLLFQNKRSDLIRMLYGDVFEVAKRLIRPMFTTPEGRTLIVSDLAQIECRTLAWLAGCKKLVEQFQDTSRDPYSEMAVEIYGGKPSEYPKGSDGRQLGKAALLGCGYGMGGTRFSQTSKLDEEEGQKIVQAYRSAYPEIPRFWIDLENAMKELIQDATQTTRRVGRLTLQIHRHFGRPEVITIRLPSGRLLQYHEIRYDETDRGLELCFLRATGLRSSVWGGVICENVTQAVARDCLAHSMLRLDSERFEIVAHVHDEVVVETDESTADRDSGAITQMMVEQAPWAVGLPLEAETATCKRYTK